MKKSSKKNYFAQNTSSETFDDCIYDPEDNLYNRPEDDSISTYNQKKFMKVKNVDSLKKRDNGRKNENS